jgi:hypothetical protein
VREICPNNTKYINIIENEDEILKLSASQIKRRRNKVNIVV